MPPAIATHAPPDPVFLPPPGLGEPEESSGEAATYDLDLLASEEGGFSGDFGGRSPDTFEIPASEEVEAESVDADSDPSDGILSLEEEDYLLGDQPSQPGGRGQGAADGEDLGDVDSSLAWLSQALAGDTGTSQTEAAAYAPAGMASLPDLEYLFQGYVVFSTSDGVVHFGRRYGQRLVDVHSYPCGGNLQTAYRSFLGDKVNEGFVPRPDLTQMVPADTTLEEVDLEEMGRAFHQLS